MRVPFTVGHATERREDVMPCEHARLCPDCFSSNHVTEAIDSATRTLQDEVNRLRGHNDCLLRRTEFLRAALNQIVTQEDASTSGAVAQKALEDVR